MNRLTHCLLLLLVSLGSQLRSLANPPDRNGPENSHSAKSQGVVLKEGPGKVEILVDGQPFTTYYFEGYKKPIFFPLRTASGTIVTRGYPMIPDVPGETKDHPHHKGLWFTHGDVNGVDFWSESEKTGRILHRKFDLVKSDPKVGLLKSENDWVTPGGQVVLKEVREVRIHSQSGVRVMDFDLKLTAVKGPVKFGDTKEGSFGIRLAQPFSDKEGGRMENSRGGIGQEGCWGKPAEWVDYSTKIEGETVGVAIFDHPSSFRHPTHWHARAYCLFAVNPFGLHDFYNDKTKDGSHSLSAGQSLTFRYRVYIHPGNTQEAKIADQYKAYAK
jgi:Methane oxygenase PmoA